jgi:two-component system, NarL family, sensor histidine kinase DevS
VRNEHPNHDLGAESAVTQSLHALRSVLDAAPDGMVLCDATGLIVFVNEPMASMSGHTQKELLGAPIERLVPVAHHAAHRCHRETYIAAPTSRPMGASLELAMAHQSGADVPVEISLAPMTIDGLPYVVATVRDDTERRALRHRVAEADQRDRLLDDRERIARDLHDTVIQDMFAAGMRISALLGRIDNDQARHELGHVIDQIDASIRRVRAVVFDLHRSTVPARSLSETIEATAREAGRSLGFAPTVDFIGAVDEVDGSVPEHVEAVVRECLSNVGRHANATSVAVVVRRVDRELTVDVTDDGVGISAGSVPGSGTHNLRARAHGFGGTVTVAPRATGGTHVCWSIPLDDDHAPT